MEGYRKNSDSVALFLEDGNFTVSKDQWKALKEFYSSYRDFCKDSSYTACTNIEFSTRLKGYGYEILRKASGRVVGVKKFS